VKYTLLESTSIESVHARKIFNGRGEETLEVEVLTLDGLGSSSAPSGKSRGREETVPYPNDSVDAAVTLVNEKIGPEIVGLHANEQAAIDVRLHELDGTQNFRSIGGNTACAVSFAVADAAASTIGIPMFQHLGGPLATRLPTPLGNVLCGGKHAGKNTPDIQEFLVLPLGATSFIQAARVNIIAYTELGRLLAKIDPYFTGGRGDEGAWAPHIDSIKALEALSRICKEVSDKESLNLRPCLDMAASSLWSEKEQLFDMRR
jgi:enolase